MSHNIAAFTFTQLLGAFQGCPWNVLCEKCVFFSSECVKCDRNNESTGGSQNPELSLVQITLVIARFFSVMEPMLLEDYKYGQLPRSISNILEYFQCRALPLDKNDILVGFLYILMLECGFVHQNSTEIVEDCDFNYKRVLKHSKSLPEGWRSSMSYRLDFVLRSAPQVPCTVVATSTSDDLLVNCVVKNVRSFCMILDPLTYFISSRIQLRSFMFQNLNHLSRKFKDDIAIPAKIAIVATTGGVCACLQDLPPELLVNIMSHLLIPDVLNLARTCRGLCGAAQNVCLWTKLLHLVYRGKNIQKTNEDLRFIYETKFDKELKQIMISGL